MTSGIYISTNKVNGRRYIGYSENIELMRLSSINTLNNGALRNHPLIQSDWNKYGENAFVSGILEVMDTTDQALLSKRSQYWKNLIKPEYNKSNVNTERQLITHEFAILAPVPEMHLKSGSTVCKREGKVAFGCTYPNFFDRVDSLSEGAEVEVFIYASMSPQSIGAKASWHAIYVGYVEALKGKHPAGYKFRPPTARRDGDWKAFWEVRDLRPLPNPIEISSMRGHGNNRGETYSPNFIPLRPIRIEYPG